MIDLKDELLSASECEERHIPFTVSRHKWWLRWYHVEAGVFFFEFVSPRKRSYSFFTERGENGWRVSDADIVTGNGKTIASYWEAWGDAPQRMDAIIKLTPNHIINRLYTLLDAIDR